MGQTKPHLHGPREGTERVLPRQPADDAIVDAGRTQLRQEDLTYVREGSRRATPGLRGIVPPAIVAQEQLVPKAQIQHPMYVLDEDLITQEDFESQKKRLLNQL